MFLPDEEHTGSFGTEHPFVSVGRQEIDRRAGQVERDDTQSLNRIDAEQDPAPMTGVGEFVEVVPPAGHEADPTGRDDPRPRVGRGQQAVDRANVGAGFTFDDADFNAARNQATPCVSIRRKLAAGQHDVVPGCHGNASAMIDNPLVVFGMKAISLDWQPSNRAAESRTGLTRFRHSDQFASPLLVTSSAQLARACFAGRLSSATAAWSKYAHRSATGICRRNSCHHSDMIVPRSRLDVGVWSAPGRTIPFSSGR